VSDPSPTAEIRETGLAEALGERYLSYALSTIMARSLPDVRDGLKPVHRRILYAMRQLRLDPGSGFKKCARVVGDVIGKYHPHGDAAVYDALVRLAQDFAQRYPLVDGQGNFGNIDGDNAAAMRYTEARLTGVAGALLEGIDQDAVDFRETYDGEGSEPVVLPAAFPNLLANGAAGIAVGMATSVPPHNAGEVCDALLHLIGSPKATTGELVEFIPGPDLPTGGELVEPSESIVESYAKGRGSFRLRARWEIEKLGRGQYQVVVTEIPYQVQKSRLVEKIAELLEAKKLALLADVRDESAAEVRIVLEPRNRTVDPALLMETLFRHTDLEVRVGFNMNVLDGGGTPRVMTLREVLQAFLDHRHEVLTRRTEHRLSRIGRRLEVLAGYLTVYANLDDVIRIIREDDDPKASLRKRWKLSEAQADAILEMRLRALRRLEEAAIRQEFEALTAERADLARLLKDRKRRWKAIAAEIADIRKRFGPGTRLGDRRTRIGAPPSAEVVPLEAMVAREPVTVVCSAKGWIRALKGHLADAAEVKYKEGDRARFLLRAESTDRLVVFATNGRFYTLGVDRLPGGRGHGEPLRLMFDLGNEQEIVALFVHEPGRKLVVATSDGRGFMVAEDDVIAQTRNGKQVLNVSGDVEARACAAALGDHVAVLGDILQRYHQDELADLKVFNLADGLPWVAGSRVRTQTDVEPWLGKRAAAGRLSPPGFRRARRFG
jgi:topoisomerase-4 subunit A